MRTYLLVILLTVFSSCIHKSTPISKVSTNDLDIKKVDFEVDSGVDFNGNYFGEVSLRTENTDRKVHFSIYENEVNKLLLSIPSEWNIKADESVFYSDIAKKHEGFFMIEIYKQQELGISFNEYINLLQNSIQNDSSVINSEINIEILENKINEIYFFEGNVYENNENYHFCSYYIKDDDTYFEVTLKYKIGNADKDIKYLFDLAAYSIVYKQRRLMEELRPAKKHLNLGTSSSY